MSLRSTPFILLLMKMMMQLFDISNIQVSKRDSIKYLFTGYFYTQTHLAWTWSSRESCGGKHILVIDYIYISICNYNSDILEEEPWPAPALYRRSMERTSGRRGEEITKADQISLLNSSIEIAVKKQSDNCMQNLDSRISKISKPTTTNSDFLYPNSSSVNMKFTRIMWRETYTCNWLYIHIYMQLQ
jgi:hypothetical protein